MKLLVEVGDTVKEYSYPQEAVIDFDMPKQGWISVHMPGVPLPPLAWFRLDRVIGILPPDEKKKK